ncbi:ABC transporter permease [Lichenifustis flavocetrariae]|uniref:ABC transporter permease n=1 Tax=Lichenifustis flavocetrariae TaxID=2949735 RepID=A0AA41YWI6_9HYPH|nr:ABC transporter permease [Lichenifustis flavocetrariae]MCW6508278.1 ABC transporter permease [Lichenifustis flavocetrariae]
MTMVPLVEPHLEDPTDTSLALTKSLPAGARSQSYGAMVWRRFRSNRTGMIGGVLVLLLVSAVIFADFLSPYDPAARDGSQIYMPPQAVHFVGASGFGLLPFTHPIKADVDPVTFEPTLSEDAVTECRPALFGAGWSYDLFGLTLDRHLLTAPEGCPFHLLGTDRDGRDMLARLLQGSRLTLFMAAFVVGVATLVGTVVGVVSGYARGAVDHWIQRVVEFVLALPELPFYFALVAIIPRDTSPLNVFLMLAAILACLKWAQLAREVRGKTLAVGGLDYVKAAEAVGARPSRIVFRHVLPNVMSQVVVATTLMIPSIVLLESFLSFLGLGVQPPLISWGLLLNAGQDLQTLGSYPWVLSPIGAILITVLGFNMLGDGLRDAMDPYHS